MDITPTNLETRIKEMFPEIAAHGMDVAATLEDATGDWLVRVGKDGDGIATRIGAQDAADCLEGGRCVMLASQVGGFVNRRCGSTTACAL